MDEYQASDPGSADLALSHPDNLRQMALALDRAWDELPIDRQTDATRHELAHLIVKLFARGERSPDRLGELIRAELHREYADAEGA
jgi:hypothetical protein